MSSSGDDMDTAPNLVQLVFLVCAMLRNWSSSSKWFEMSKRLDMAHLRGATPLK